MLTHPCLDTVRLTHLIKIKTHLLQAQLALASSQPKDATTHATKASSLCDEPSLQDTLPAISTSTSILKARCTYWLGVASHHSGNYLAALECYKAAEPVFSALMPGTPGTPQALGVFEARRIDRMKQKAMLEVLKTPMKTGQLRVCRDVEEFGVRDPVSADWRAVRCENLEEELRDCASPEVAVAREEPKMSSLVEETSPARRELHMRSSSTASISSTGSLAERRHRSRPSEILLLDKLSL